MPEKPAKRIIRAAAMPTAIYSTKAQVQGPGGNKTLQYLRDMDVNDPGQQGFYREALNDIPHPLAAGKTMTYGGLQQLLNSPQRAAALEAYARQNRLPTATADQMLAAEFAAAKPRLLARGAQNPDQYAFPVAADSARRAPTTALGIAHGNFAGADGAEVTNAAVQAQRFADLAGQTPVMAAPGMAVRVIRGTAPVAPRRVIAGTIASR